jgi:hypothetical protein
LGGQGRNVVGWPGNMNALLSTLDRFAFTRYPSSLCVVRALLVPSSLPFFNLITTHSPIPYSLFSFFPLSSPPSPYIRLSLASKISRLCFTATVSFHSFNALSHSFSHYHHVRLVPHFASCPSSIYSRRHFNHSLGPRQNRHRTT